MASISKRQIVRYVTNALEKPTQEEVTMVVDAVMAHIVETLAKGDTVVLRNFGTFEVHHSPARKGRNPKINGSEVLIPERAVVKFRSGKEMREKVAQALPTLQLRRAMGGRGRKD